jgi:hypothetical protein
MVVQMFVGPQKRSSNKIGNRLSKEHAREQLLAILPERTYQVATFNSSPAQIFTSLGLDSLLEEMILTLQINLTLELLSSARKHLGKICNEAEHSRRSFDASIEHLEDGAKAKVHIRVIGASEEDNDEKLLCRIRDLSSNGGVFQRITNEAILLHRVLADKSVDIERRENPSIDHKEMSKKANYIRSQRRVFSKLHSQSLGDFSRRRLRNVRSLSRDVLRTEAITQFRAEITESEKLRIVKELFGDHSPDTIRFFLDVVFSSRHSEEVRETACCGIEGTASTLSVYDANELGRKLLARLTGYCVSCKFDPFELGLLLRLLGVAGEIEVGTVVAQLIESEEARAVYRGHESELAILVMTLDLLSRGGSATRCLEKLVLGIGIEHLSATVAEVVRAKAAYALGAQQGSAKTLIQLLEFYRAEDRDSVVPLSIAESLARDDSSEKVLALVEIAEELYRQGVIQQQDHLCRIIRALRETHHPAGAELLKKIIIDKEISHTIRLESAISIRSARGAWIEGLIEELPRGTVRDRAVLIEALSGNPEENRTGVLVELFAMPFEPREGIPAVQEQSRLLRVMKEWKLF